MTEPTWRTSTTCSHLNSEVCPTCDFDRYYATAYPETCPWAVSQDSEEADPASPRTEPIALIQTPSKATAHYPNVGPRVEGARVLAADVSRETGLPNPRELRRGTRLDRLDRGLWVASLVTAGSVGAAVVWALIAEPMGWL